jgi:hypothetical protein
MQEDYTQSYFRRKEEVQHLYFRDTKGLYISYWEWFCSSEDF